MVLAGVVHAILHSHVTGPGVIPTLALEEADMKKFNAYLLASIVRKLNLPASIMVHQNLTLPHVVLSFVLVDACLQL